MVETWDRHQPRSRRLCGLSSHGDDFSAQTWASVRAARVRSSMACSGVSTRMAWRPARRAPSTLPGVSSRNTASSGGMPPSGLEGVVVDRRVRLAHPDLGAVDHDVEELVDGHERPPRRRALAHVVGDERQLVALVTQGADVVDDRIVHRHVAEQRPQRREVDLDALRLAELASPRSSSRRSSSRRARPGARGGRCPARSCR